MTTRLVKGLQTTTPFLIALPLLALLHEIFTLVIAGLLNSITRIELLTLGLRLVLKSPVHSQLVMETLGGIKSYGIAVPGVLGLVLQQTFPRLFLAPEYTASGAWISAILGQDSTVLSLFLTRASVEIVFVMIGTLFIRTGLQNPSRTVLPSPGGARYVASVVLGLFVVVQATWTLFLLTLSPSFEGLEEMGIGFALSLLLRVEPEKYAWLMERFFPIAIPLALLGIGFLLAWLLGRLLDRVQSRRAGYLRPARIDLARRLLNRPGVLLIALLPWVALNSQTQSYFGLARTNLIVPPKIEPPAFPIVPTLAPEIPGDSTSATDPLPTETIIALLSPVTSPTPEPTLTPQRTLALATRPVPDGTPSPVPMVASALQTPTVTPKRPSVTRVRIRRTERGRLLIVNGHPTVLTGMNYNVNYTALPDETKRSLHRRDLQIMKDMGVNAIIGWGVYDEVTLEIAHEFGIGVVMPFELDPQGAYENQNYREQIKDDWKRYIKRFQRFPAVWAWNPGGDELLHRMDTEQHRTVDKLQSAADFLVELSTIAHSLDPNRVSVIKEPRDWYIPHLHVAVKKARALSPSVDPGEYLIFGVNIYGKPDEIADALETARRNAEERLGVALLVGEYAPFGLPRKNRAIYYTQIWDEVSVFSPNGGFAYVFGPDQPNPQAPNPYDPLRLLVNEFSLVDSDGNRVDDAFSALGAKYHRVGSPSSSP